MVMALLLYDQFIHYTQINVRPNRQCLSIQQDDYHIFISGVRV